MACDGFHYCLSSRDFSIALLLIFDFMALWDFAWLVYRDVNFSPQISGHCLSTLRTDCTDFSTFFALLISATCPESPKDSRLILARPCEILKN